MDDNEADVHWLEIVLRELHLQFELTVLTNGEQALNLLLKRGAYANAADPEIVFLDINLPRLTGLQVLAAIHNVRNHPVCIVTGSRMEQALVREQFQLARQCYIVKPADRDRVLEAFDCFEHLQPIAEQIRKTA